MLHVATTIWDRYSKNTSHKILAPILLLFLQIFGVELSKVECPTKHIIGHIGDGFLRVKWPNQQCQSTEGR